uniref:RNA helicase n=1 Tax=Esox lucius TaxID=8010 RepID=A0A6Q2Y6L6_ESOLU
MEDIVCSVKVRTLLEDVFMQTFVSSSLGGPPQLLSSYEYPSLPITKNRQELISLIENNSVVIIRGATGSGKTTQLPQFILDYYNEKDAPCNLVVTQPRKIAASSIARWVARERKCTLGSLVGYQVGLEKMATEHTRLIYMTTGVLLQKLVAAKSLTEFSHIFIDEVHERSEELDFLLLVVRKLLRSNSRYVKVILMSATINCKEFAEYFGTLIRSQTNPAYVFEVKGAPYAIEEFYLDDLHSLSPYSVNDPYITTEMYNVAVSLIQSFDDSRMKEEGGLGLPDRGSVAAVCPTYGILMSYQASNKDGTVFYVLSLSPQIILSTNIAESSVTVPDVKYVIDFCLARHMVCDKETNYQSLRLTWASKTNCNQRKGRAGRVSKGYCYRLVTKEFWRNEVPDYVIPEMMRAPLANIMLKVKLLDMGDPRSLLSAALSPPNLSDIERTVLQLKEMGALSIGNDGQAQRRFDGDLTFLGRMLAHLPVDLHLGKMIVLGHVFGCLQECLIIAASLSLKSFFAMPTLQLLAGYRSKLSFANGVPSDHIAFVNAFKAWHASRSKGELRHPKDELEWGKENCIQIKRIREVAELYEDLKKRVSQFNMHVIENPEPMDYSSIYKQLFILQVVIAGAYYPNYFAQGEMDEELASKDLSGHDPKTTVNLPPYSFLYYKQLQSLFRQCGQVKSIAFDGSRGHVEFYRTAARGSVVLPEVSLALFLAHQRHPLDLLVHSSDEVEARSGGRIVGHLRYARISVHRMVDTESSVPEVTTGNPFVTAPQVVEVGHFWGFQADEASIAKQRNLTSEINSRELCPIPASLYPNLLCLAPFSEGNEQGLYYYRAKVLHVRGSSVEVFFLDFGNTSLVSCSCLRELPADIMAHQFQAKEFQIAGMLPSAQSMISGDQWSSRARNQFITLVNGRSLLVSLFSILHGVMRVELLITTDSGTSSVADIMIQQGHAISAEESFESKVPRKEPQTGILSVEHCGFTRCHPSLSGVVFSDGEKQLIDSLLQSFSKTSQSSLKTKVPVHVYPNANECVLTASRSVLIEKDSINSVALNERPQDSHQRMLVAGSVSVSTYILLRETTLMPHIHGLPALLTMLFSPVIELRSDSDRTSYTGALCGLGWNVHSREAVLPERDMELSFDVRFDVEDITEVNALRGAINRLVCEGPNGPLHLGPDRINSLQNDCRERLMRLFTKSPPRADVVPVFHEEPNKWNQVDPSQKMEIVQKEDKKNRAVLFQLHPVTLLNM